IRSKTSDIVNACRYYMSQIPDCETNLRAIPEKHDINYVQKWFSRSKIEIGNKTLSFDAWARELFLSNKRLITLVQ
ncbi:6736_t:CDS:1, partial [Acaulospora morrowiae]